MTAAEISLLDVGKAIVGQSGSGKTVTAKAEVEQLLRQRRHLVIIDITDVWWGLRSDVAGTGPGFDLPIFGGRHGDVPIGPGDGDAIARLIIEQNVSAIVSLAHMHDDRLQREFLAPFIKRLRAKSPGNFHLIADEAEEYCPQTAPDDLGFELTRDMIWIAKRGRVFGFVLTLITQRPADVSKAVLSQMQTIVAHQLVQPHDQKAIDDYLKAKGDKDARREVMSSIASLAVGERWIYSPRLHLLERDFTPAIATFDSSRTPAPGEVRVEPKLLSEIDVSAIAAALQKPREEVAVAAYQAGAEVGQLLVEKDKRIEQLEGELAEAWEIADGRKAVLIEVAAQRDRLARFVHAMDRLVRPEIDLLNGENKASSAATANQNNSAGKGGESAKPSPPVPPGPAGGGGARRASSAPPATGKRTGSASPEISQSAAGAAARGRKALLALARIYPATLSEAQWATLAGYAKTGGTWGTYKGALRAAGLVELQGDQWSATAAGVTAAGVEREPLPPPGADRARFWGERIPGARRMVEVLVKRWPHFTTRDGLAADLGMAAGGGTFGTYLGRIRANGLLEEQGKKLRLSAKIMGEPS